MINNVQNILEVERKFLINECKKKGVWEKEHIVFQWFLENTHEYSKKVKIVFSLRENRKIFVSVVKKRQKEDVWEKSVSYLLQNEVDLQSFLGCPFVAKRRSIQGTVFLDVFYKSNEICDYLLEIEGEGNQEELNRLGIVIGEEVTNDCRFQNGNMTIPFTQEDKKNVEFLLAMIPGIEMGTKNI